MKIDFKNPLDAPMIFDYWANRLNSIFNNQMRFNVYTGPGGEYILWVTSDECPMPGDYTYCRYNKFEKREELEQSIDSLLRDEKFRYKFYKDFIDDYHRIIIEEL